MGYCYSYKSNLHKVAKTSPTLPTEYDDQVLLTQYLELKGLLFSKTAQETFTRSWGQKMKNKASGLRKGLPDMFIFISAAKSKTGLPILACIELKRIKGGVTNPEQKEWIESLDSVSGISAVVAKGFDEAKKFVDSCLK